jgi:hypothetical protein
MAPNAIFVKDLDATERAPSLPLASLNDVGDVNQPISCKDMTLADVNVRERVNEVEEMRRRGRG